MNNGLNTCQIGQSQKIEYLLFRILKTQYFRVFEYSELNTCGYSLILGIFCDSYTWSFVRYNLVILGVFCDSNPIPMQNDKYLTNSAGIETIFAYTRKYSSILGSIGPILAKLSKYSEYLANLART